MHNKKSLSERSPGSKIAAVVARVLLVVSQLVIYPRLLFLSVLIFLGAFSLKNVLGIWVLSADFSLFSWVTLFSWVSLASRRVKDPWCLGCFAWFSPKHQGKEDKHRRVPCTVSTRKLKNSLERGISVNRGTLPTLNITRAFHVLGQS